MTADEVRDRVCLSKRRHWTISAARRVAEEMKRDHPGELLAPYRCPFAVGDRHWHVGHVPSLESLERIARVIRGLDPEPRTEEDPHHA